MIQRRARAAGIATKIGKRLWTVERTFRTSKSLFETRPIYHKLDETIRDHVSRSFLALVLKKELEDRIAALAETGANGAPPRVSWPDILADLDSLTETRSNRTASTSCCAPRPDPPPASRCAPPTSPPTVRRSVFGQLSGLALPASPRENSLWARSCRIAQTAASGFRLPELLSLCNIHERAQNRVCWEPMNEVASERIENTRILRVSQKGRFLREAGIVRRQRLSRFTRCNAAHKAKLSKIMVSRGEVGGRAGASGKQNNSGGVGKST
jgi:hypothetical protein